MVWVGSLMTQSRSRPAWGGWIEMIVEANKSLMSDVPPRMGRVD